MSEFHGVRVASAMTVAPAAASSPAVARGVVHLERDADVPGDAAPDLDLVDEGGVRRVGQLERGDAGFQDHDTTVRRGVRGSLAQAEHVAVEVQRLVVVLCRHDEPQFAHGCHVDCNVPADDRRIPRARR